MLDETDPRVIAGIRKKALKPRLALDHRQGSQVLATLVQKIEGEIDEIASPAFRNGGLQGCEIRYAMP